MVLISRIFTYLVPLVYLIVSLIWLIYPSWVFFGSIFVILLLIMNVFTITRQVGTWGNFLIELIYPLLTQIISLAFLVFLSMNWLYVIVVFFFAGLLFFILNESFERNHPILGKSLDFNAKLQMILIVGLVFFLSVISYNFVLYLNWQLWFVSLVMIVLISLLLLRLQGTKDRLHNLFINTTVIVLTMELFFVLYYLPIDIYFKGLFVALNLLLIFTYIVKNYLYKITKKYDFEEKTPSHISH
jgi:hypothetical protein